MDYNEILSQVKTLFLEKLDNIVQHEVYEVNPLITKHVYLETVYTDIMSLGYNYNDIIKSADDIYEMQSALHGESNRLKENIKQRVIETATLFPELVRLFSDFHSKTQNGESFVDVLLFVKLNLNKE